MNLRQKIYYTSGQLGMMLAARYFFQWIISFAPSVLLSTSTIGILIFAFRIYDALTDPLAGYLSDKLIKVSRFKLMNSSIPIFVIGLALCFYPESSMSQNSKWLIEFCGMLLFFTGYTFYCIPYWALVGDYSNQDITLSRTLSNLLGLGLLLATAIGFLATPALIDNFGHKDSSLIIALLSGVLMTLPNLCPKVEKQKAVFKSNSNLFKEIFGSMLSVLKNKKFLKTCILFVGSQMSLTIMTAAAPFIATKLLAGKTSDVAFLMGPMLVIAMPSFFISQKLSKHWGWEKSVYRSSIFLALLYCLTSTIGTNIFGSPLFTASIMFSLSGLPIAILLGLEAEAVTFCAQDSKAISTHFGAINFLIKTFNGLALMLTGWITEDTNNIRALPLIAGCCLLLSICLATTSTQRCKSSSSTA